MKMIRRVFIAIALSVALVMMLLPARADDVCAQFGVGDNAPTVCVPFP